MDKVLVFGTGQIANVAYSYLTHDSPYEVAAFAVDRDHIEEDILHGLPVVPYDDVASTYPPSEYKMFIAVAYLNVNKFRAERYHQAKAMGYQLISYVHSRAIVSPDAVIGDNCAIHSTSVILPYARVGNNVHIGAGAIIGHHSVVGDHCWVTAGTLVLGSVTVEPYCFLGGNSTIRNSLTVAKACVIGAGALILGNTQEGEVYTGEPAERLPISSEALPL